MNSKLAIFEDITNRHLYAAATHLARLYQQLQLS